MATETKAADVMTSDLVTVSPDATIEEVARTMLQHDVDRVLVGHGREIVGVVTTTDLLRVIARGHVDYPSLVRHTGYSRGNFGG